MSAKEWKTPLNLAIAFHLIIALGAVYLPDILKSKPRFEDVYTVNLINLSEVSTPEPAPAAAEPVAPAAPKPKPQPKPEPKPEPQVEKVPEKAVPIAEPKPEPEPAPEPSPAPEQAISIKPSKQKIKKEVPVTPPKPPERDLSQVKRQKLAEMIKAEQTAAEEARILAEEAELEKRLAEAALRRLASSTTPSTSKPTESSTTLRSTGQLTALENQYYSAVIAKLQAYWALPEYKEWPPALRATLVITINKDGKIADSFFETPSGDKIFDRFVTKALQDAREFPPIPSAMKKQRMEIGLNFTPGGIR
jgi:colicin import membrane protein